MNKPFDGEAFGKEVVQAVRGFFDRNCKPIIERQASIEARIANLEKQIQTLTKGLSDAGE